MFQSLAKKFGAKSPQVWINYAHFAYYTRQSPEQGRAVLARSLQALDKAAGLFVTSRCAAMEFRSPKGFPERGRTLFEGLLDMWPKRFDLWNQRLDLETALFAAEKAKGKDGEADPGPVRDVLERGARVAGLKPRRAKVWFQRWAKWEEENGDSKSRDRVSSKAREWAAEAEKRNRAVREGVGDTGRGLDQEGTGFSGGGLAS